MSRRLTEWSLVLATHNPGKLEEFQAFFAPRGIELVASGALGLDDPEETGETFADNARLKAGAAAAATGRAALADDSGLEVLGLDGAPGVLSARWAGPERDFTRAMAEIRRRLVARYGSFERADRRARFMAVLCLAWPDGHDETVQGAVNGLLVDPPRGSAGFGYDPMFQPEREQLTFAEMAPAAKAALSHRGRALAALEAACLR
jgi:XTP/dITP diphosphohydrolase